MLSPKLSQLVASEHARDLRDAARAARAGRRREAVGPVTIRRAVPADAEALARLAELDSRHVPSGDALVAEVDGALVAAMTIDTGQAVADPFRPTREIVWLLALRAAQVRRPAGAPARLAARPAILPR